MTKICVLKNVDAGSKINQFLMAIILNIPILTYGLAMAWSSPIAPLLLTENTPLNHPMSEYAISWMASIMCGTAIAGVFIYGYMAEKLGRKLASMGISLSFLVCFVMKLFLVDPWVLILARAIAGLGAGGCFVVIPMYVKEISDDSIRGALGSLLILIQNCGYLMMYVIGDLMSYHGIIWICCAMPILHIALQCKMPESPSYLVKMGKVDEAVEVIAWLRNSSIHDKGILEEVETIKMAEQRSKEEATMSFRAVVSDDPITFRAFRIALTLMAAQEMNGCFVVIVYAGTIFQFANAGNSEDYFGTMSPNRQAIFIGVVQIAGSFLASSLIEKCGRKPLLLVTCAVVMICNAVLGGWFYLVEIGISTPSWIPIVTMSLCIFCNAAGFTPIPYVVMSELFTFQVRATVTIVIISIAWAMAFAVTKVFAPLVVLVGIFSTFWIFAIFCLMSLIYIITSVPETKGKTLEQIYEQLDKNYKKKSFAES